MKNKLRYNKPNRELLTNLLEKAFDERGKDSQKHKLFKTYI